MFFIATRLKGLIDPIEREHLITPLLGSNRRMENARLLPRGRYFTSPLTRPYQMLNTRPRRACM